MLHQELKVAMFHKIPFSETLRDIIGDVIKNVITGVIDDGLTKTGRHNNDSEHVNVWQTDY
jgi:hypothetical protein